MFAIASEDERTTNLSVESVKGIQAFINPEAFKKVYQDNDEDTDQPGSNEEDTGIEVDIDNPEDLERYLEHMFHQAKHINSQESTKQFELEV